MKMSPMHFEALRVAILARYSAADRVAMWSRYVARGLSATRFRWDMFWGSGYQIQKLYDAGLNDLHIDAALRRILPIKDLEPYESKHPPIAWAPPGWHDADKR